MKCAFANCSEDGLYECSNVTPEWSRMCRIHKSSCCHLAADCLLVAIAKGDSPLGNVIRETLWSTFCVQWILVWWAAVVGRA